MVVHCRTAKFHNFHITHEKHLPGISEIAMILMEAKEKYNNCTKLTAERLHK